MQAIDLGHLQTLCQLQITSNEMDNVIMTIQYTIIRKDTVAAHVNMPFDTGLERARKQETSEQYFALPRFETGSSQVQVQSYKHEFTQLQVAWKYVQRCAAAKRQ
jgi:hypothetical protein